MAIELTRPVRRKVYAARGDRALVVTLVREGLQVREAGRRTSYLLPYGVAFLQAVRLYVDAERAVKAAARKARRQAVKRGKR